MNVGIVGLGLIGGSMAKSIKARTGHTVFGIARSEETLMKPRFRCTLTENDKKNETPPHLQKEVWRGFLYCFRMTE